MLYRSYDQVTHHTSLDIYPLSDFKGAALAAKFDLSHNTIRSISCQFQNVFGNQRNMTHDPHHFVNSQLVYLNQDPRTLFLMVVNKQGYRLPRL